MSPLDTADRALLATSRTFYLPISQLPPKLRKAVTSAYLSLRAIDEIEDHERLDRPTKISLLNEISRACKRRDLVMLGQVSRCEHQLPEVTTRICEWVNLAPIEVQDSIWDVSYAMSKRMAYWTSRNWKFQSRRDFDRYTFDVAGRVGILLSKLWHWNDGTQTNTALAREFGRGLQAVNILRNRKEDLIRGVDLFPRGWDQVHVLNHAKISLSLAYRYLETLPRGPARDFCRIPLMLAYATLDALERGDSKLSRTDVLKLTGGGSDRGSAQIETVILVNEEDEVIGVEEKLEAHERGSRHRAFSIFVFNSNHELLLQKRAATKYHSPGRWSNSCCGHPRFGESIEQACHRRLWEEMGFDCSLNEVFSFTYYVKLDNRLIENEYDHVLVGKFDGIPHHNLSEVEAWQWISLEDLRTDLLNFPDSYTPWLRVALSGLGGRVGDGSQLVL